VQHKPFLSAISRGKQFKRKKDEPQSLQRHVFADNVDLARLDDRHIVSGAVFEPSRRAQMHGPLSLHSVTLLRYIR
jgi:hypothetical protein